MGHARQYKHSNDRKAAACIANITLVSFPYLIHAGFGSGTETKITPSQVSAIMQLNCPHPPLHSTSCETREGEGLYIADEGKLSIDGVVQLSCSTVAVQGLSGSCYQVSTQIGFLMPTNVAVLLCSKQALH